MRTHKNILRHELVGLRCTIVHAAAQQQQWLSGTIVNETMKTVHLQTTHGRKIVRKQGTIFRVVVGNKTVDITGDVIIARPEDRIKKKFKMW